MTFSFNAKYALLTYAQCGELDAFRVMDHLTSLSAECIIGREHHEDGGIHLHVFCDFGRKFRSRRTNVFDVDGFHPNISGSTGNPEKGYDYAIKDGDVICGGLARPTKPCRDSHSGTHAKWSLITSAPDRELFWDLVHELDPKAAATSFSQLQRYCDWKYQYHPPNYESPGNAYFDRGESDGRSAWLLQSRIGMERMGGRVKSLVLYGPSQTGKTSWARSLGKHIYCVGLVSGAECMKAHDVEYAVFDDIRGGMKFFPSFKEWLGCQPHVCVKELYREPKVIEWGKPSIWCSNADPRHEMLQVDVDWMEANVTFIEVSDSIVEFA